LAANEFADEEKAMQWSIAVDDLDKLKAEELAAFAKDKFSLEAVVLNPAHFFTSHMDRETVVAVRRCISAEPDLQDVVASFDEWLAETEES
jgi:hypothetical protein